MSFYLTFSVQRFIPNSSAELIFFYSLSGGLRYSFDLRDSMGGGVTSRVAGCLGVIDGVLYHRHSCYSYTGSWPYFCKYKPKV